MRYFTCLVFVLFASAQVSAQESKARPFDGTLDSPTQVTVVFSTDSNETQYLGFDWVNGYCFGAILGCAVQNQPATASWITRIAVFSIGDWRFAADCRDQKPTPLYLGDTTGVKFQLHPCNGAASDAVIQLRKNERSLTVVFYDASLARSAQAASNDSPVLKISKPYAVTGKVGKHWSKGASVYTLESAYNVKTKQVIGDGTVEQWTLLFMGLRMQQDLKTFQPQMAVKLIDQIKDLREYNLVTSDRLGKLLEQDEQENSALIHQPKQ